MLRAYSVMTIQLQAREQLQAAAVAILPRMKKRDRKQTIRRWTRLANGGTKKQAAVLPLEAMGAMGIKVHRV